MSDAAVDKTVIDFYARKRWSSVLGDDAFTKRVASGLAVIHAEMPRSEVIRGRPSIESIVKEVARYLDINEAEIYAVSKGARAS